MRSFEKHAGPNFRNACDALGLNARAQNVMGFQVRKTDNYKQFATNNKCDSIAPKTP